MSDAIARIKLREQVREWAQIIGLRAAARKFNVKEHTALMWGTRYKWPTPKCWELDQAAIKAAKSAVVSVRDTQDDILASQGEETRLMLSAATLRASHAAAQSKGEDLISKDKSIGVLNAARTGDVIHGWSAARQQGINVGVQVNIPMPTPEEQERRRKTDEALDAIAAKLLHD